MPGSPRYAPARRRWLAWVLGGIAVAAALWMLVGSPSGAPLDDIGAASRAQLDDALRDAERAEPAR